MIKLMFLMLMGFASSAQAIECASEKTKSPECAAFREKVAKEDARRLATFNAVNNAHPTASTSPAKFVRPEPQIGMSSYVAKTSSWGEPKKVTRTTTATKIREQWIYDKGYLYFENGVLTIISD